MPKFHSKGINIKKFNYKKKVKKTIPQPIVLQGIVHLNIINQKLLTMAEDQKKQGQNQNSGKKSDQKSDQKSGKQQNKK